MFNFFKREMQLEEEERYIPIGRNLLRVDNIKKYKDNNILYKKKVESKAFIIERRGCIPDSITNSEDVLVPLFEIACKDTYGIINKNISSRRTKAELREKISKTEDGEIIRIISGSCIEHNTIRVTKANKESILMAIGILENNHVGAKNILINPLSSVYFRTLDKKIFKPYSYRKYRKTSCLGKLLGAKVWVSTRMLPQIILFLPDKKYLGVLPINQKTSFRVFDELNNLKESIVAWESIGICLSNSDNIVKIIID